MPLSLWSVLNYMYVVRGIFIYYYLVVKSVPCRSRPASLLQREGPVRTWSGWPVERLQVYPRAAGGGHLLGIC